MITEIREMNSFEETIHMENIELKKKIEVHQEMIKDLIEVKNKYFEEMRNLQIENEFLKYKNSKYREEIWNQEINK